MCRPLQARSTPTGWTGNRDTIEWYVDGFLVSRLSVSITQPEYLIADLAVNGKLPPNSAVPVPPEPGYPLDQGVAASGADQRQTTH